MSICVSRWKAVSTQSIMGMVQIKICITNGDMYDMYDIQLLFLMETGAEVSIWCNKDKWATWHGNMSCSKPASQMSMSAGLHEQMSADQENMSFLLGFHF